MSYMSDKYESFECGCVRVRKCQEHDVTALQSELSEARAAQHIAEEEARRRQADARSAQDAARQLQSERDALKAAVERVRKTWMLNWQEQKDRVEELRAVLADVQPAWCHCICMSVQNDDHSTRCNVMKAALVKGEANGG